MANKTIINSAPPRPSKRIIGGSNQRSKARLNLQNSHQWRYNHAPVDSDESKNATWWQEQAERYGTQLSSSGEDLYSRQAIKRELNREVDRGKLYNIDSELDSTIAGGSNQPFNKKYHLGDKIIGAFDTEIDITDTILPNVKKRVTFGVTIGDETYTSEQAVPFSTFSSSITTGYQAKLSADGFNGVAFNNLHDDKIQSYQGEIPVQGPFTERYVGGILSRHNALLRTTERQESFNIVLSPASPATVTLAVDNGVDPFTDLDGKVLTLTLGGVSYSATFNDGVDIANSTKTALGIADALDADGAAEAIVVSLNAAASADNLPLGAVIGSSVGLGGNQVLITGTFSGTRDNGTAFAGNAVASGLITPTPTFAGGSATIRTMNEPTVGNPQGKYLRGLGPKAPVNIGNIKTLFTSDSVRVVGNYIKNHEVVQGANRAATNLDIAYNTDNYGYQTPTAFLTTPARRTLGLTGSADFPAPRQVSTRKINETIIVNRFSAPGDKVDSKQQFRDVASDQFSSNNAIPFRNLPVRNPYIKQLATHAGFGGFEPGSTTIASVHKTQRNQTQRVEASENTFVTGTIYDAYFVTRPIPAGDSTQWFFALSGSDTTTYSEYVLNGNRYPESVQIVNSVLTPFSASTPAAAAQGFISFASTDEAATAGKNLLLTDNKPSPSTVQFIADPGLALNANSRASAIKYNFGVADLSSATEFRATVATAIAAANTAGDLEITLGLSSVGDQILDQAVAGAGGNTAITGSLVSFGLASLGSSAGFSGGADFVPASGVNFGSAVFTSSDGKGRFIWADYGTPYSAPWAQLGAQYKNAARYLKKNNIYEILPNEVVSKDAINNVNSTQTRTSTDQAGNTITNFYSQRFVEPPITSRYKPLVHQVETFIGSPSETTNDKIVLNLEYSYGNSLMGFANRELNRQLAGNLKFAHNKLKRPYEALREQLNSDSSRTLNGVNMIKMFAYNETIFPREINTYLSGSRARLAFANSYWRNDASIEPVTAFYANFDTLFYIPAIEVRDNRQVPRLTTPFTTSQGYVVQTSEQLPYNSSNPGFPIGTGPGTASIWPMDSYLWSDLSDTYAGLAFETGSFSASVILADQATTACGELMMTHFGTVDDKMTDSDPAYVTGTLSSYGLANIASSQYVYSVAFVTGNLAAPFAANFASASVEPRIPGGAFSRPAWTAASQRRLIDGENKGDLTTQVYPFYDNYDQWAAELRLKGKAHTIIPEYRVSEHVSQFQNNNSLFTAISSSLEITGANANNFDGTNTDFYTRYATTDNMEFLSDFMTYDKGDVNFIFNDYPRHFEINSDAIIKLLPYDGFYPVNRTLEISTLFSQSYGPAAQFTGSDAGQASQWRALLRPYFAPGIIYNSIKSGVAVDYPIRRLTRNGGQYDSQGTTTNDPRYPGYKIGHPLFGGLYGRLTSSATYTGGGTIPGNERRNREDFDWSDPNINAVFWADRLPFESILAPEDYLTAGLGNLTGSLATVMSDINEFLHLDVTASFVEGQVESNNLYKKAVSNFLANVPQFFLKTKENKFGSPGKLTKFVSQFGSPSKGSQEITAAARTVAIDPKKAYMMEIGLMKTDQFNMYSNPAAFGPATSTSYIFSPWEIVASSGSWVPSGSNWPTHRGEFAPFTPPYYYGPSLARITFMPLGDKKEYTLEEILNNDRGEVFVDFLNESGSYYDATSGSYVDAYGNTIATDTTPDYQWNRAWINRMDIDASINIDNEFPTSAGSSYKSADPNKWTIMPKWESPVLDFPNRVISDTSYNFSSSVNPSEFTGSTQGMWHQYGCTPNEGQGVYMYIKDIPTGENEEYDLVARYKDFSSMAFVSFEGSYHYVRKVPKYVIDSNRTVSSLADLCGFDPDEIIRKGFDPKKAKRLGELAENNENSISEAIVALPFYLDENGEPKLITLQASPTELGPKIKEFRKNFTKYSLPPVLAQKLLGLVPKGYPTIADTINPFGGDEYDELLSGEDIKQTPVVYLMEHTAQLTKQDLADIWQGIMPDLATRMNFSFSAIDHYMPGDNVEDTPTQFPEVLKEQINLGAVRDGNPRYDLLDIAEKACKQGFFPEIKWLVFKIKEKGYSTYAEMIAEEVDGPNALGYDNAREFMTLQGLPEDQVDRILGDRDDFAKNAYISKHSLDSPTYNWPYDYCSLIESVKINSKVGFRPDLEKEYEESAAKLTQQTIDEKAGNK